MDNRSLAEKIYKDLKKRGAEIGNASIGIIKKTFDEQISIQNIEVTYEEIKH